MASSLRYLWLLAIIGFTAPQDWNCGEKRTWNSFLKITGGETALASDWPWQALFATYGEQGRGLICGASLISKQWLLTSAHCAERNHESNFVALGETSMQNLHNVQMIARQIIHPGYNRTTVANDIALLQMKNEVQITKDIMPICLSEDDSELVKSGSIAFATGFDLNYQKKSFETSQNGVKLMEASLPIIDHTICMKKWRMITGGKTKITDKQICAGSFLQGTAPGDRGGSLQVKGADGRWYLIGITSFGANSKAALSDQETYPGVYTRVSPYIGWIRATIDSAQNSADSQLVTRKKLQTVTRTGNETMKSRLHGTTINTDATTTIKNEVL